MERCFKILLVIVMFFTVMMFANSCGLDKKIHALLNPQYETTEVHYIMRHGDTVWNISENYFLEQDKIKSLDEFIYFVRQYNGLVQSKRIVQIGDVIIIPLSKKVEGFK